MSKRFSSVEKGKNLATQMEPPRASRVFIPQFDPAELVHDHSLMFVGRITNLKMQKMWAFLPFLADHWKVETRPIGADLGQGRFQYQFATEEDLQKVLNNRPYHFVHWMVIVQRWEPTVSPSFPSQISFWIQVKGVPSHLWSRTLLLKVDENIGIWEESEVTKTTARVRVIIDGLKPLMMTSTLEFCGGDELEADLHYEKLEKHCSNCFYLSHEVTVLLGSPPQQPSIIHPMTALIPPPKELERDQKAQTQEIFWKT